MSLSLIRVMPFSSLIGQERVQRALLMLSVNPHLNGVLLRGERGTAKSTAARGLATLIPAITVNQGCRFGCDASQPVSWCSDCLKKPPAETRQQLPPFETLPLGITEDQLLGTIDIEEALRHGRKAFEPGLLARVNHGVLYVDEVNLLDDHIVDLLLDSAAAGVNVVAREGVAVSHPATFMLVGTMNPEEGDLRPQLLDRFGLCVEVTASRDPDCRVEIIKRCLDFEGDPAGFRERWADSERQTSQSIARARERLSAIEIEPHWLEVAARLSLELEVDGHRADMLLIKSAACLAALDGLARVGEEQIAEASTFVYPHRLQRRPFESREVSSEELIRTAIEVARQTLKKKSLKPTTSPDPGTRPQR